MKNLTNKWMGILAGILVAFSFPMLRVTHFIWSEPLFISFTTATIYFLTMSRHSDHSIFNPNLMLGSMCACAAILTRYVGVALIPIFFLNALILIKNRRFTSKYILSLVAIILPMITAVALFVRNYMISGLLRGIDLPAIQRSYLSAFTGTIEMIFSQFELGKRSAIGILIFMLLFISYTFINKELRREMSKFFFLGLDLIIMFILSYTGLIFVSMVYKQPNFELRFMSPLVPFLFIVSLCTIFFIWKTIKLKGFPIVSLGGIILSLNILIFGTFYKTYQKLPYFFEDREKNNSFLNSCIYNWVVETYSKDVVIATNEPFRLSFYGGYFTIRLPTSIWDKFTKIPEDMDSLLPNRMSEIGARGLVLFNEVKEEHYGKYLAALFNNREGNDKFLLVHECEHGVVYELRKRN